MFGTSSQPGKIRLMVLPTLTQIP